MEGTPTLAPLKAMCIMEVTASGKGPRALTTERGLRMAGKKNGNMKTARAIFESYVAREREKLENRYLDTTNAYDDFAKAASIINPDITTEELDKLYFENYNSQKYRHTARHWWESDTADVVVDIMRDILATAPTDKFMSRTDILERAGVKRCKPRWSAAYWEANALHAFELLEEANVFSKMDIMTCGKVFIHMFMMV